MSQLFEKLPLWAKLSCVVFIFIGSVYYIDRDGPVTFILKAILSP
jgi:hypothetical protein